MPHVGCFYFDSIGVPSAGVMQQEYGGGEQWQAWALEQWLGRLDQRDSSVGVAVLDAQVRPSSVAALAATHCLRRRVQTVLFDCGRAERDRRLVESRGQPDLATGEMAVWAAYLRGQADALALPIVDTTRLDTASAADLLANIVSPLLGSTPQRLSPHRG